METEERQQSIITDLQTRIEDLERRLVTRGTRRGLACRLPGGRTFLIGCVSVAAALVVSGAAFASIPDSGGVIHGCYSGIAHGGPLLLVDSPSHQCAGGLTSISWNQTGPQGPRGAQGAQGIPGTNGTNGIDGINGTNGTNGVDGAAGPAGPPGLSDAYIARFNSEVRTYDSTPTNIISLSVPAGSYVLTSETVARNAAHDAEDESCALSTGARSDIRLGASGDGDQSAIPIHDLATFASTTTVILTCVGEDAYVSDSVLTAIKVGTLH